MKEILGVEVFTFEEVMEMLDVSKPTLIKIIKEKGVKKTKIGMRSYFTHDELLKIFNGE